MIILTKNKHLHEIYPLRIEVHKNIKKLNQGKG